MAEDVEVFEPSKATLLVNKVVGKTQRILVKKYPFKTIGVGLGMPEGIIEAVDLSFYSTEKLTKEILRMRLIDSAQELLKQINNNEEIQSYLIKSPFTIENVQIIIYNSDIDGMDLYDPEICVAEISYGILTYNTNDPEDEYKYKNEFIETYDDALRALLAPP